MANSKDKARKTSVGSDYPTTPPSSKRKLAQQSDHPTIDQSSTSSESRKPFAGWESVRFFGDYELLEEIARGGMGVVFKARQVNLNRIVALKMILAGHLATEQDVRRFHTEAEAAANLQNPNIVAIHEVGQHNGQHYYSMEFVEGQSLAEVISENPLPPSTAARYAQVIAQAIQYAHDRGTLHRDLKPSNILIDQNDQPRVTDFGLAKQIHSDSNLTASGAVLGTPSYVSPEQVTGDAKSIGPATDIYAIGALLYELLTGRPPFIAETPIKTIDQVVHQEPAPPCILNPAVPKDLETICLKCLQKEPKRRYASAEELAIELTRFLSGEPIKARPIGRFERITKWARRQPAQAALIVVSLVAIIGILAGVLWHNRQLRDERDFSQSMKLLADQNVDLASRNLSRSLFEQARSERVAGGPGRRWRAETLLQKSLEAIPDQHPAESTQEFLDQAAEITPSPFELRSELAASLLLSDAMLLSRWSGSIQSLSPNGGNAIVNEALLIGRSRLRIANSETGKQVADLTRLTADFYALSPQAEYLALATRKQQLVDIRETTQLNVISHQLTWPPSEGKRTANAVLKFSPNGKWLAGTRRLYNFGSRQTSQLAVWPISGNDHQVTAIPTAAETSITPQFSRDGDHLVFEANPGQIAVWDLASASEVAAFDLPRGARSVQQLGLSASADLVAGVFATSRRPRLVVWDTRTKEQLFQMPVSLADRKVHAIEFSPEGQHVAIATDTKLILIMDLALQSVILQLDHDANELCWTGKGLQSTLVSSGLSSLNRWRLAIPDYLASVAPASDAQNPISEFQLSHDGQSVVIITTESINVHQWPSGKLKWSTDLTFDMTDFGFSDDDSLLFVSGYQHGTIFDAENGTAVQRLPMATDDREPVHGVFLSPDELFFIGERENNLGVWDGLTNQPIWPPDDSPLRANSNMMRLSRDSRLVAYNTVEPIKGTAQFLWNVEVWDRLSNSMTRTIPGITFGDFSRDARWLATTRTLGQQAIETDQTTAVFNLLSRPLQDEEVLYTVWDLHTGEPQVEFSDTSSSILESAHQRTLIEFSDDGHLMAIVKTDGTVTIWNLLDQATVFQFSVNQLQGVGGQLKQIQFGEKNGALLCVFEDASNILTIDLGRITEQWATRGLGW